jgi:hypothetical protein
MYRFPAVAYSFSTKSWRNVSVLNESAVSSVERPVTRGGQAVATMEGSSAGLSSGGMSALLFGGECHLTNVLGLPFRDTWNYTMDTSDTLFSFVPIVVTDYPESLLSHRAVMVEGRMCMFGGLNLQHGFNRDLFCLS